MKDTHRSKTRQNQGVNENKNLIKSKQKQKRNLINNLISF